MSCSNHGSGSGSAVASFPAWRTLTVFFVALAMWCHVPLWLPDECQQVLRALRACKVFVTGLI